jgi:exoribonuclease R
VIQEQEILRFMQKQAYKPMTLQELLETFGIEEEAEREQFQRLLAGMEAEGQIVRTRTKRYGVPERLNLVRGTLQGHPKGFGFVVPDIPGKPDVFVHPNDLNGAMDGDRVLARLQGGKRNGLRPEGEAPLLSELSRPRPAISASSFPMTAGSRRISSFLRRGGMVRRKGRRWWFSCTTTPMPATAPREW